MTTLGQLRALLAEVDHAGGCTRPVRLAGSTLDQATGEWWEGAVAVACKDRRVAVCPACAARYRGDAWHLVVAGLRGGKGVPEDVAAHPAVFATLTAPSFGPVHTRRETGPCRPRRRAARCPHANVLACGRVHAEDDPTLGEPLCPACFGYAEAIVWNAHVGRLWNRTTVLLRRTLARVGGLSERTAADHFRLSYVKVAEFQRRGLVHLHAVVRVDGPAGPTSPPPPWTDAEMLTDAVRTTVAAVSVGRCGGGSRLGWGHQLDVVAIGGPPNVGTGNVGAGDLAAVAGYLAKYAVKGSEGSGALATRLRSVDDLAVRSLRPHHVRLVETAWALGEIPALEPLRLQAHAHTFGYPGHFATKSVRYSTTFGALRSARTVHRAGDDEVEGDWRYAGRGYPNPRAATLAAVLADRSSGQPRTAGRVPRRFPTGSPEVPHPVDQG
jgi:replication initiator protein RepSA